MTSERGTGRASSRYKRMQINSDGEFRFSCHDGSRRSVMCGDPVSPAADSCRRYPPPRRVSESFGLCVFFPPSVRRPLCFHGLSTSACFPPSFVRPLLCFHGLSTSACFPPPSFDPFSAFMAILSLLFPSRSSPSLLPWPLHLCPSFPPLSFPRSPP